MNKVAAWRPSRPCGRCACKTGATRFLTPSTLDLTGLMGLTCLARLATLKLDPELREKALHPEDGSVEKLEEN